jgi:hypothetical protein
MRTGSWTYFREAIAAWGYAPGEPLQNLARNTVGALLAFPRLEAHAFHSSKVDVLVMVVMIAALFASTARLPAHWSVYLGTTVLVPLLSKDLMSYGRYAVAAWPAFVLPALVVRGRHRRWALPLLLALFLAGRLLLVRRLVAWEWVG